MNMLEEFLKAIDFKITGGSEYAWSCFGPNARYLDCDMDSSMSSNNYSIHAVFDSRDHTVYAIEAWDYKGNREYRWVNPIFKQDYIREAVEREIDPYESFDERRFVEVELVADIFEKIRAIIAGEDYDTRLMIPINLDRDYLYDLMMLAHSRDLTLNELVEDILRQEIGLVTNAEEQSKEV